MKPAISDVTVQGRTGGELQDEVIVRGVLQGLELHLVALVQLQVKDSETIQLEPGAVGDCFLDAVDDGTIGLCGLGSGHLVLFSNPIDEFLHCHRIISLRHKASFLSVKITAEQGWVTVVTVISITLS